MEKEDTLINIIFVFLSYHENIILAFERKRLQNTWLKIF